jgi:uridine kinase
MVLHNNSLNDIIQSLNNKNMIICVSGAKGSGKTTASDKIAELLPNAKAVHCDNFTPEYFIKSINGEIPNETGIDWSKFRGYRERPWALLYNEDDIWDNWGKISEHIRNFTQERIVETVRDNDADFLILEQYGLPSYENGIWNSADYRVVIKTNENEHLRHLINREKVRANSNWDYGDPKRRFDIKKKRQAFADKFNNKHTLPADYTLRHNYENDETFENGVNKCVNLIIAKRKELQNNADNVRE